MTFKRPSDDDLKRIAADAVAPGMRLDDIAWGTNTNVHFRAIWDAAIASFDARPDATDEAALRDFARLEFSNSALYEAGLEAGVRRMQAKLRAAEERFDLLAAELRTVLRRHAIDDVEEGSDEP